MCIYISNVPNCRISPLGINKVLSYLILNYKQRSITEKISLELFYTGCKIIGIIYFYSFSMGIFNIKQVQVLYTYCESIKRPHRLFSETVPLKAERNSLKFVMSQIPTFRRSPQQHPSGPKLSVVVLTLLTKPNSHSVAELANSQSEERLIIIETDTKHPVLIELQREVREEM